MLCMYSNKIFKNTFTYNLFWKVSQNYQNVTKNQIQRRQTKI